MYFGKVKGLSIFVHIKSISITLVLFFLVNSSTIDVNKVFLSILSCVYVISDVVLMIMTKFSNWGED